MTVSNRHTLHQGPVILSLLRTAGGAVRQVGAQAVRHALPQRIQGYLPARLQPSQQDELPMPGPLLQREVRPRPADLVADYIQHVGGDPAHYPNELPPHFFPQWALPLSTATLAGIPYPLMRVVNGGCRLEINAPLPADQPLHTSAQLLSIDDDGRRAVLHQQLITATDAHPQALVAHFYAIVPLARRAHKENAAKHPAQAETKKPSSKLVPPDAIELERWTLDADAGLDFARLTGDFNPIHWVPAHARAFGFKNVVLHGFSTLARAFEGLARHLDARLRVFDVQFTRPLPLPAQVGLFLDEHAYKIYVGAAPGAPAYLIGTFEVFDTPDAP